MDNLIQLRRMTKWHLTSAQNAEGQSAESQKEQAHSGEDDVEAMPCSDRQDEAPVLDIIVLVFQTRPIECRWIVETNEIVPLQRESTDQFRCQREIVDVASIAARRTNH